MKIKNLSADDPPYYCLTEGPKDSIISVLNGIYISRAQFFKTMDHMLLPKCILDWGEERWEYSCLTGRFAMGGMPKPAGKDSMIQKAGIINLLSSDSGYAYRIVSIPSKEPVNMKIGVCKVADLQYCIIKSGFKLCYFYHDSSFAIIRHGTKLIPAF